MIKFEEAYAFISRCCRFFEHKFPSEDTAAAWAHELANLDPALLDETYSRFTGLEGWPRNYVYKIKEIHNMVKKTTAEARREHVRGILYSYYRDHQWDVDREAGILGIDPMIVCRAELAYPLARKGDFTRAELREDWRLAKKGTLPAYLIGDKDEPMPADPISDRLSMNLDDPKPRQKYSVPVQVADELDYVFFTD